jgi:hypothetical protein
MKYFVQFDGGVGSYFEADDVNKAKATAAIALEGYQNRQNPKGTARLLRVYVDGRADVVGEITADFRFQ